jgi:hypothetical protein
VTEADARLVRMLLTDIDDHASFTQAFVAEFLRLGSTTPDNVNAADRIEYGVAGQPPRRYAGLKLRGRDVLLTDLAHAVEDAALPAEVRAYYPDLTEAEWHAATRMITMLLLSLDRSAR